MPNKSIRKKYFIIFRMCSFFLQSPKKARKELWWQSLSGFSKFIYLNKAVLFSTHPLPRFQRSSVKTYPPKIWKFLCPLHKLGVGVGGRLIQAHILKAEFLLLPKCVKSPGLKEAFTQNTAFFPTVSLSATRPSHLIK